MAMAAEHKIVKHNLTVLFVFIRSGSLIGDAVILLIIMKHLAHKVEMCFDLCYNLDISLKNKSKKAFYNKISQLQKMKSIA